jgi:hypothetical protein
MIVMGDLVLMGAMRTAYPRRGSDCGHDQRNRERCHRQKQCVVGPAGNCGKHLKISSFSGKYKSAPSGGARKIWGRNLTFLDETSLRQVTNCSFDTGKTAGFLEK